MAAPWRQQTQLCWSSTAPRVKERLEKQWSESQASTSAVTASTGGTKGRRLRLKTVPADLPRTEPSPEAAPAAVLTEAAPGTSAADVAEPAPSAADADVMSNLTCTLL